MSRQRQHRCWIFAIGVCAANVALAFAIVLVVTIAAASAVHGQTFNVIHDFTGGVDGANPYAGLTIDAGGTLYGTALNAGVGYGTVFKLSPGRSGWRFNLLYSFTGGADGAGPGPYGRVIFGPDGSLYGTTLSGGGTACQIYGYVGCGTVFKLTRVCAADRCPWAKAVLYSFSRGSDGSFPEGDLRFDHKGNLFGTVQNYPNPGNVYELVPSGNTWAHTVLYTFNALNDGCAPSTGVIFDNSGNLYGASSGCGIFGTLWQLIPSQSGWSENVLYRFAQDGSQGANIYGGLLLDQAGNFYGVAAYAGSAGGGTAFELTSSNGNWTLSRLYGFSGPFGYNCGSYGSLIMDQSGNLYGTTACDGSHGAGSVFKLTPSAGTWVYSSLHDFAGGSDGAIPLGGLVFDSIGNIYGTTQSGGSNGKGVVFQITP